MVRLFSAYFDPEDSEMRRFIQQARLNDPYFYIFHEFSVALLARQVHPKHLCSYFFHKSWIPLASHERIAYLCE